MWRELDDAPLRRSPPWELIPRRSLYLRFRRAAKGRTTATHSTSSASGAAKREALRKSTPGSAGPPYVIELCPLRRPSLFAIFQYAHACFRLTDHRRPRITIGSFYISLGVDLLQSHASAQRNLVRLNTSFSRVLSGSTAK